ncbi:MAG: GDSL-type esterase/lipase family protein [Patescibacteria group bacterium]
MQSKNYAGPPFRDAQFARNANIAQNKITANTDAKIMVCGDSITAQGATSTDERAAGYRYWLQKLLRLHRGNITWLGTKDIGPQVSTGPYATPGNVMMWSWRCAALGGYTIQQIDTLATEAEAAQGAADVYTLLAGTNNYGSDTAAQAVARIVTFIQNRIAANPDCVVLVGTLLPAGPPVSGYATKQTYLDAFNAALPAALAPYPQARIVPVGTIMTKAHLIDGIHPNIQGEGIIGKAFADAILNVIGISGAPFPRPLTRRVPVSRLSVSGTQQAYFYDATNASGLFPTAGESWYALIKIRPSDLSVSGRLIFGFGGSTTGILLMSTTASGGPDARSLQVYHYVGPTAYSGLSEALRVDRVHAIGLAYDADLGEMTVYCLREGDDGKPVTFCVAQGTGVPELEPGFTYMSVGYLYGVSGVPGTRGDFVFGRGVKITPDEMEAYYMEGAIPQSATAYYPLNEGTGTSLNPSPSFAGLLPVGVTTAAWTTAGVPVEPWDREEEERKKVLADAWEDLRFPASQAMVNPVTAKPDQGVFTDGIETLLFDPDADESVFIHVQMPHAWKLGSSIVPHVHWSPMTTHTGVVRWGLEYTVALKDGTFGASTTIYIEDAGDGVALKHQTANFAAIVMSAYAGLSVMLMCRLFRDADHVNDTFTGEAALLEFDIHYVRDDNGSQSATAKYA